MDADRRRTRAIRRLARWWNPAATAPVGVDVGRRFAVWRFGRAKRAVERCAVRDVLVGDPATVLPAFGTRAPAVCVAAAFAVYRRTVDQHATDDLATGQHAGAAVHGEPPPAPLRRDRGGG